MNEGRLRLVSLQTRRRRKLTTISNLHIRDRHADYSGGLDRERIHVQRTTMRHALPLKRSLVDLRGYSKCLKRNHREHGGTVVCFHDEIKGEIEEVIKENHPKVRRLKRTQQMLESERYSTLDASSVIQRMDTIMGIATHRGTTFPTTDTRHWRSHQQSHMNPHQQQRRPSSKLRLPPIDAFHTSRDLTYPASRDLGYHTSRDLIGQPQARAENTVSKLRAWLEKVNIKDDLAPSFNKLPPI